MRGRIRRVQAATRMPGGVGGARPNMAAPIPFDSQLRRGLSVQDQRLTMSPFRLPSRPITSPFSPAGRADTKKAAGTGL